MPCAHFAGYREGYAFKTDEDYGTGYFLDTPPVPEVTPSWHTAPLSPLLKLELPTGEVRSLLTSTGPAVGSALGAAAVALVASAAERTMATDISKEAGEAEERAGGGQRAVQAAATLFSVPAKDYVLNRPQNSILTDAYLVEQIADVPNMNNTGRLPAIAMVHLGMTVRLANTVEAPEAVTDSTGVVIGIDLDPNDVGRGGVSPSVNPPGYTLGISLGSPNVIKIYTNVEISKYLFE